MANAPAPGSGADAALSRPPLLTTKLYIPSPRRELVPRPRLTTHLNEGLSRKLTLISAPAGFGKTTVLSAWIPQSQRCVVWVSLDEGDNDPTRFWVYFISAIQKLQNTLGENALRLLQSPQPPPLELILTTLLNELATFPDDFALVLDDYHLIENLAIHQAITFLLDHLLPQMHLMITTRVDPPLPLSRLRARGQLTELRAADLRFTPAEVATFLNEVMGLNLSPETMTTLETRTEGWIAGLQLAALSMQGRQDINDFIKAFAGSHRFILDYLTDEVLERRPKGTKNFLLQTAILDRLCGPLCDAVTGQSDAQMTLERLVQANLFIVALDDERKWYRYHHLFAEVLRQGLHRSVSAEAVADLHRRASAWYEQAGLIDEAIHHALTGHDFERAARLIERVHSAKWQIGEIKTLQGWLATLPLTVWSSHPRLWLVQAWAAITIGEFSEADEKLREAEEALTLLDEAGARSLRPEVLAFRASYASLVRDPAAVELAQQALRELPQDYWLRGMLVVFLAAAYYNIGELKAAAEVLAQTPATRSNLRAQPHQIHLLTLGGMIHYAQGKLRQGWSLLQQALEVAEPGGKPMPFVGTLFVYMSASQVAYELGELDQVEGYLTRCATQAGQLGSAEAQVFALSGLAHLRLAYDDMAAAVDYFNQVDGLLRAHTFNINIMAFVEYYRFQLLLRQGNFMAAAAWAEAHSGQLGPLNPYFHRLALPQIRIAQGDFDTALGNLTTLVQAAQATGQGSVLIKALVLQALAFHLSGNYSQALPPLERALTLAAPEGYIRTFVDEGKSMVELLRRMKAEDVRRKDYIHKLLSAFPAEAEGTRSGGSGESNLFSPLPPPAPLRLCLSTPSARANWNYCVSSPLDARTRKLPKNCFWLSAQSKNTSTISSANSTRKVVPKLSPAPGNLTCSENYGVTSNQSGHSISA